MKWEGERRGADESIRTLGSKRKSPGTWGGSGARGAGWGAEGPPVVQSLAALLMAATFTTAFIRLDYSIMRYFALLAT